MNGRTSVVIHKHTTATVTTPRNASVVQHTTAPFTNTALSYGENWQLTGSKLAGNYVMLGLSHKIYILLICVVEVKINHRLQYLHVNSESKITKMNKSILN